MPISFDNSGHTIYGNPTQTNSPVVDITNATVGSLVFVLFANRLATGTVSTFAGWTSIGINRTTAFVAAYDVWYRVKQAGDTTFTATLNATTNGTISWASYLGIMQNSTLFESAGSTTFTNTSYTTPSETPSSGKRWAVAFFDGVGGTTVTAISYGNPTGMVVRDQAFVGAGTTGNRASSCIADTADYAPDGAQTYTDVPTVTGGTAGSGYAALLFLIEEPLVPEIEVITPAMFSSVY